MVWARFPRLESIFGCRLEDLDEGHIRRLVDGQVDEASDLEFKRDHYGGTDKGKRELASDVAGFANESGGLIVIGIDEVDGHAESMNPVDVSEAMELMIKQVIASGVMPFLNSEVVRIPTTADQTLGYVAIIVAPSSLKPHAVLINEGFRYPIRDGRQKRYMSESEVAIRYRDRFALARERVARVEAVESGGLATTTRVAPDCVWLSLASVPENSGRMHIDMTSSGAIREWVLGLEEGPTDGRPKFATIADLDVRPGPRRMLVDSLPGSYGELHQDGSSFIASVLATRPGRAGHIDDDPVGALIFDELLASSLLALTRIAVGHIIENAKTFGDVLMRVRIDGYVADESHVAHDQMYLVHARDRRFGTRLVPNTHSSRGTWSELTLDAGEIWTESTGWVLACHYLMKEVVQSFALAEPLQFDELGQLRTAYLEDHGHPWVDRMKLSNTTDEELT